MSELNNCCGTTCDKIAIGQEMSELLLKVEDLQILLSDSEERESEFHNVNSKQAAEINELKVHINQLQEVIDHYRTGKVPSENAMNELVVRASAIPAQHLVEHSNWCKREGYVQALVTYTDETKEWCNEQGNKYYR